jgi:hypothetical protein
MNIPTFGVEIRKNWFVKRGNFIKLSTKLVVMHPEDIVPFLSRMGLFNEALDQLKENIHYKIDNRLY